MILFVQILFIENALTSCDPTVLKLVTSKPQVGPMGVENLKNVRVGLYSDYYVYKGLLR